MRVQISLAGFVLWVFFQRLSCRWRCFSYEKQRHLLASCKLPSLHLQAFPNSHFYNLYISSKSSGRTYCKNSLSKKIIFKLSGVLLLNPCISKATWSTISGREYVHVSFKRNNNSHYSALGNSSTFMLCLFLLKLHCMLMTNQNIDLSFLFVTVKWIWSAK